MENLYLTGFAEETDPPDWDASTLPDPLARLRRAGLKAETLVIAPLSAGWTTELAPTHYRSGAGPLEALADASAAIREGHFDAVLITGAEPLRSGYSRTERHRLMGIYGDLTIPQVYDLVSAAWCEKNRVSPGEFTRLADALYQNHSLVAGIDAAPDPRWLTPLTPLQRGIDCANPLIDWRGQVVVANRKALEALGEPGARLTGVGYSRLTGDGPGRADEIADFRHLSKAMNDAQIQAGRSIAGLAENPETALELYTCYPVVPLAFLQKAGLGATPEEILLTLARIPITVTGGMNLARAPWNLPALRGLARVGSLVARREKTSGVVHANGGAGYAQGVAILELA